MYFFQDKPIYRIKGILVMDMISRYNALLCKIIHVEVKYFGYA